MKLQKDYEIITQFVSGINEIERNNFTESFERDEDYKIKIPSSACDSDGRALRYGRVWCGKVRGSAGKPQNQNEVKSVSRIGRRYKGTDRALGQASRVY
jgi:hypothetical protein